MKKRLLVILLALAATLCLAFALSACAPAPNDNAGDNGAQNENTEEIKPTAGLEYKPNDGNETYACTGLGTATSTDIIIASKVNGKPVTAIGDGAFENCTTLTSVTIPDSVTSIGYSAFADCDNLLSVTFENKTGWQVSENENMSGAIAVNVDDAQNNSKLFRDILGASVSYYNYYWKRVG